MYILCFCVLFLAVASWEETGCSLNQRADGWWISASRLQYVALIRSCEAQTQGLICYIIQYLMWSLVHKRKHNCVQLFITKSSTKPIGLCYFAHPPDVKHKQTKSMQINIFLILADILTPTKYKWTVLNVR